MDPAHLLDVEHLKNGCRWCDAGGWSLSDRGQWVDDFGDVLNDANRVCARPNWARQAPISGMAFGDSSMHNLLRLRADDFVALFDAAEEYIALSRRRLAANYFVVFINGGVKSASSVSHAHGQIVGRIDRHFAYAERIVSRCPADYWQQLHVLHEQLGLAISHEECALWVNLAPTKEKDISITAPSLHVGARFVHAILGKLFARGTNSYSLAAILSPPHVAKTDCDRRYAAWPPVTFRLVDRGDIRAPHSDIGSLELFGSTVVGADPFEVVEWLRE